MPKPIRETRVLKLVFITIPCLKFWALSLISVLIAKTTDYIPWFPSFQE